MDMVFTTCSSVSSSTGVGTGCSINMAYNKQLQLCTSNTASGVKDGKRTCRPPDQLCLGDSNFSFDFTESNENDVRFYYEISNSIMYRCNVIYRHSFKSQFPLFSQVPVPLLFWSLTQRTLHPSRSPLDSATRI
jgi:hypothetical protein